MAQTIFHSSLTHLSISEEAVASYLHVRIKWKAGTGPETLMVASRLSREVVVIVWSSDCFPIKSGSRLSFVSSSYIDRSNQIVMT